MKLFDDISLADYSAGAVLFSKWIYSLHRGAMELKKTRVQESHLLSLSPARPKTGVSPCNRHLGAEFKPETNKAPFNYLIKTHKRTGSYNSSNPNLHTPRNKMTFKSPEPEKEKYFDYLKKKPSYFINPNLNTLNPVSNKARPMTTKNGGSRNPNYFSTVSTSINLPTEKSIGNIKFTPKILHRNV
jgi:hypothetical protein